MPSRKPLPTTEWIALLQRSEAPLSPTDPNAVDGNEFVADESDETGEGDPADVLDRDRVDEAADRFDTGGLSGGVTANASSVNQLQRGRQENRQQQKVPSCQRQASSDDTPFDSATGGSAVTTRRETRRGDRPA